MAAEVFDTADPEQLRRGLREARRAIAAKRAVVIPTDTHYALVADGFSPAGRAALQRIKNWSEPLALQVLLPGIAALDALAEGVPETTRRLAEKLWPGALTLVCPEGPTLQWSLGEGSGQVALRVPDHPVALELLQETGPLAATAAHPESEPVNLEQLLARADGELAVVLVDPERDFEFHTPGSSVVDTRGLAEASPVLRLVREGAISAAAIESAAGLELVGDTRD